MSSARCFPPALSPDESPATGVTDGGVPPPSEGCCSAAATIPAPDTVATGAAAMLSARTACTVSPSSACGAAACPGAGAPAGGDRGVPGAGAPAGPVSAASSTPSPVRMVGSPTALLPRTAVIAISAPAATATPCDDRAPASARSRARGTSGRSRACAARRPSRRSSEPTETGPSGGASVEAIRGDTRVRPCRGAAADATGDAFRRGAGSGPSLSTRPGPRPRHAAPAAILAPGTRRCAPDVRDLPLDAHRWAIRPSVVVPTAVPDSQ